jgi:alkyldihydroxyacetonephosphate synthase
MRRWNGWGEEDVHAPLTAGMIEQLSALLGPGVQSPDATLEDVVRTLPAGKAVAHDLVSSSATERAWHARGQSFPDWVALRSGQLGPVPDGVAHPTREDEILRLMTWARTQQVVLIPYGGGTSVAGHINAPVSDRPVVTLALDRYTKLEELDGVSQLARFQTGVRGVDLDRQLARHGFRLGHYPQSYEYSTLGGWIATRSSGQQSLGYGRIEDLVAGCRVIALNGVLDLPDLPASAAGPDLKHWILGSEGRLGVITRASLRVSRLPEHESFHAVVFESFSAAMQAVRELAQQGSGLSMLRLSDAEETSLLFALPARLDRGLSWLGYGAGRCILLFGVSGSQRSSVFSIGRAYATCRAHGGLPAGPWIGRIWQKNRFRGPYLRNSLWDAGYAVDTLETALPWTSVAAFATEVKEVLGAGLATEGERVVSFLHLSHVYADGASIYVTYLFRRTTDPQALTARWSALKAAASQCIVRHRGTISHQHGVGTDHAPYLHAEKSELGIELLRSTFASVDPRQLLNPGKLLPDSPPH